MDMAPLTGLAIVTGLIIGLIVTDTRLTIGPMAIRGVNFTAISVGVAVMMGEVICVVGAVFQGRAGKVR
jgi:ACR3 family arsenite efflux pump ArsB